MLTLARQVPFAAVAHAVGESRHRVHAICKRYVELALVEIDLSDVTSAAVDETCYKREHEPFVPNEPPSLTSAPGGAVDVLCSECEIASPASFRICGATHAAHGAQPFQGLQNRGMREDVTPARMVVTAWRAKNAPVCLFFIGRRSPRCARFGCKIQCNYNPCAPPRHLAMARLARQL